MYDILTINALLILTSLCKLPGQLVEEISELQKLHSLHFMNASNNSCYWGYNFSEVQRTAFTVPKGSILFLFINLVRMIIAEGYAQVQSGPRLLIFAMSFDDTWSVMWKDDRLRFLFIGLYLQIFLYALTDFINRAGALYLQNFDD